MTVQRVNCVVIGLVIVLMIVKQCAGACDRETIKDYIKHCSHLSYISKRSIKPEMDKGIMGRLRSPHSQLCTPINQDEIAEYDDPQKIDEDEIQKVTEMLRDYGERPPKDDRSYGTKFGRRRSGRHVLSQRGGLQCDIRALREFCGNKK